MVWVVTHLWRERVVAHDFATTSFGMPVWAFCRSFFHGNALLIHILFGPRVAPVQQSPDGSQVSCWHLWSVGRRLSVCGGMENATCLCTFQKRCEPGLINPQTSAHMSGMDPSPHSGGRHGGVDKVLSVNASSIVPKVVFAAISPWSTIEVTCNQFNFLKNHSGTKSEDELLGNVFLFGVNVAV